MRLTRLPSVLLIVALSAPLLSAQQNVARQADWIDSPEAYFLTGAERSLWNRTVLTDSEAKAFIEEYWHKRGEAFRKQVQSRIEFADAHFGLGGVPGSQTAKGRVWMILGSPTTERIIRTEAATNVPGGANLQNNSIEQRGRITTLWMYRQDRLPKNLGLPSLTVTFLTDMGRRFQNIDNLGQVEPYLAKAAELFLGEQALSPTGRLEHVAAAPSTVTTSTPDDPLWKAQENLAGTFVTGEPFISPTDEPFYALSFYVPRDVQALRDIKSVLFVGLVRNADGQDVAAIHEQTDLQPYSEAGDRYVDRSIALPPGRYSATFALFTPEGSTLLANHHTDFDVLPAAATHVSSLLLTSRIDTLDKQLPLDPFTFVATKYAVKGDRRFVATDRVGFFTIVNSPNGEPRPSIAMQMIVSRDGKLLDRTPSEVVPLTQTGPHTWLIGSLFEPGTFKPGHYALELNLRDMNADKASDAYAKGYAAKTEFEVVR